uniref:Uncharacterized protein n=1 Tax=Parascaris equorum TaxID=6256 RepID=A0A914RZJ7_PAREQ
SIAKVRIVQSVKYQSQSCNNPIIRFISLDTLSPNMNCLKMVIR